MALSRKYYRMFAEVIADTHKQLDCDPAYTDAINQLTENLCSEFKRDNANFDKKRFIDACKTKE